MIDWIRLTTASTPPPVALLCIPFAGGGPSSYSEWPADLPGLDVIAASLPGRERRFREPAVREVRRLTRWPDRLSPWIEQRSYAVFGHSFGALVAFELVRALRRAGSPPPRALFVSGCRAPHLPPRRHSYALPEDEFITELAALGGTPREVLSSPELLELLLPVLRADFEAAQRYECATESPIDCDVHAICGDSDAGVSVAEVTAWERHTAGRFRLHVLPGDHFFVRADRRRVTSLLAEVLAAPHGAGAAG